MIVLRIVAKYKNFFTLRQCHTVVPTRSTVYRDPKAAQRTSKTDCGGEGGGGGADGWQPKKLPQQHLARETSLLGGVPESNHGCPGPRDIKRDGHNRLGTSVKRALSISDRAKVQSQPRSSPRWGNGRSRAQWKTFKKWWRSWHLHFLMHRWHRAAPGLPPPTS